MHTNSMGRGHGAALGEGRAAGAAHAAGLSRTSPAWLNTVDPLGGSYFVEALTNEMERRAYATSSRIDALGGVSPRLRRFFQREIADRLPLSAGDRPQRTIVGVNDYLLEEPVEIPILGMDPEGEAKHLSRLNRVRRERDGQRWQEAMTGLERVCREERTNTMPAILAAVQAYATLGEVMGVMRKVFGEYRGPLSSDRAQPEIASR